MANVTLAKVKALCTSAEHDLVKASRRPEIGQLDAAALKKHVTQARKLRDKWRDQSTKQRRDTQQRHSARVADGEKRSEQKAEIFDAALTAFENQLEKASAAGVSASKATPKKVTKEKRSAGHRAERAVKRGSLEAAREELNAAGKPAKKKVAKKATAAKVATTAAPKKKAVKKTVKKKTAKKGVYAAAAKKAVKQLLDHPGEKGSATKSTKGVQSEGLVGPVNEKNQRGAQTAAKQERLDQSGVRSRLKGHASASGRRSQGKRDSRG